MLILGHPLSSERWIKIKEMKWHDVSKKKKNPLATCIHELNLLVGKRRQWQFQTIGVAVKSVLHLVLSHKVSQSGGKYSYNQPTPAHYPLLSVCLYRGKEKWQTLQLAREHQVTWYEELQMLQPVLKLMCGSILVSCVRKWESRKSDGQTKKTVCRLTTTDTHQRHFFD